MVVFYTNFVLMEMTTQDAGQWRIRPIECTFDKSNKHVLYKWDYVTDAVSCVFLAVCSEMTLIKQTE